MATVACEFGPGAASVVAARMAADAATDVAPISHRGYAPVPARPQLDFLYATIASQTLKTRPAIEPMIGWRKGTGTEYMSRFETV